MTEPGSPTPVITGVVTDVMLSPSVALSDAGDSTTVVGTAGTPVSIMTEKPAEVADTLAAPSVAVVVKT